MVLRCLAGTWRHPVTTDISPGWSRLHRGHTRQSFCLLSDQTIKMTSYSRQTSPHIYYVLYTHTRLQNIIIYIPVKNKTNETNTRERSIRSAVAMRRAGNISKGLLHKLMIFTNFSFMLTLNKP